ncbi:serine carboxypeptidase-like 33 [Phtheirospermum japonicum]|uniref:Serine carboxypeptidase-like 33 n=1 Tax=Phtheirospermum japonicum TaxID=374723 RepID=A0A830CT94_9LAMI|nr:serine carboxypeptidase-like 33 [Phtheirospermum japonicum]
MSSKILLFIIISLVALNACCNIKASNVESEEYERDRVIRLPGQPKRPNVSQFSGYITVNEAHGRALFYWFFESQSQPTNKPLLLWLNGGPGCSSIGFGAALELGPLKVAQNGVALEFNQHAWNKEANLLFVESPVGVGFSYTNTSRDFNNIDDKFVGHYVPQLAELVHDRNKNKKKYPYIKLKGLIVGNPETSEYFDYKGIVEYAWSHAVISDENYYKARATCDFKRVIWSNECVSAMDMLWAQYSEIDIYNIYAPSCLLNQTTSTSFPAAENGFSKRVSRRRKPIPGGYDPCYSVYTESYFNRIDVQTALHVTNFGKHGDIVKWKACNDSLFYPTYNMDVFSVLPIYTKLTKQGLKIWMYSGDADGRVPVIGTRYCVEALQLRLKTNWTSWFYDKQVAGRIIEYQGLTFVTVRGAGHMVPFDKPNEAFALIHSYLSDQPLLTHKYN